MRIIYHHRIRSKDGQGVHLEELVDALKANGHEILLVGPPAFARATFGHDPGLLTRAKQLVPKAAYELVEIAYNLWAYARLLRAYRKFRPDFIYERSNLYSLAGILLKKTVGVPLLLEVNAPLARERASFGGLAFPRLARRLESWTWRNADSVLPVTHVLADEIQEAGVNTARISVIPNAIDPGKFGSANVSTAAKTELGLGGKVVLGFTGFVRTWHGLDSAIDLLARRDLPENLHVFIVGDGPAIPELKARSQQLGVERSVTFAGLVERDRIARVVSAFDIALLPKCVDYCSPLKIFEYIAAGKAIVAPDQANIREVLTNGVSGLLFAPEAEGSMAEAIVQVVRDDALRARLGREAQSLINARGYTWLNNAKRVSAIGADVMQRTRALIPQTTV